MASNNNNSGEIFSPAQGLTDGFNVGATSTPPEPSVYPDIDMTGKGSAGEAPATKEVEAIGGVGSTKGAFPFAQLSTAVPDTYNADGDPLVGGIGTPPKA